MSSVTGGQQGCPGLQRLTAPRPCDWSQAATIKKKAAPSLPFRRLRARGDRTGLDNRTHCCNPLDACDWLAGCKGTAVAHAEEGRQEVRSREREVRAQYYSVCRPILQALLSLAIRLFPASCFLLLSSHQYTHSILYHQLLPCSLTHPVLLLPGTTTTIARAHNKIQATRPFFLGALGRIFERRPTTLCEIS